MREGEKREQWRGIEGGREGGREVREGGREGGREVREGGRKGGKEGERMRRSKKERV